MPIALRDRPVCHYCGKKNKPVHSQKFRCQHCLADNFLDENGEIADVPAEVAAAPQQYAYPIQSYNTDSIFCSECLKNQAFYTAALSEFLPEPDDPEYEKFEAALPAFKKRIEKQYPQCCARCEPKVRAQLQRATYNARADHLRRVLQKSRARRLANRLGWRSLFVFAAGIGNFASICIQLLWHGLGSQSIGTDGGLLRASQCVQQWPVQSQCVDLIEQYLWISLLLGVSCVWWNPKWQSKLQGQADRLKGLSTYYRFQALVLVLRFTAWVLIKDIPMMSAHQQKLHSVFLIFITLITAYGMLLVKVDNTPLVDWQQETAPLLAHGQLDAALVSPPSSQEAFSMDDLMTAERTSVTPWHPPTPPLNEEDVMDWDPSPVTFTPQPKRMMYKSTQPTPFHGVLPQVPGGSVFAGGQKIEQRKPMGIPMGFFDKPEPKSNEYLGNAERTPLAQPKFFPRNDRADTGLENIFGEVFSLHDDALEVRPNIGFESKGQDMFGLPVLTHSQQSQLSINRRISGASLVILGPLTCLTALLSLGQTSPSNDARMILLGMMFVSATNVIAAFLFLTTGFSKIFHLMACGGAIILFFGLPEPQSLLFPLWAKLFIGLLCSMMVQSIFDFCTSHAPKVQVPPTPIVDEPVSVVAETNRPAARRSSVSSVATDSSIATTSTASGWKTPITNHRLELADTARPPASGLNTLGLASLGINDFSTGNTVAGPRNRRTAQRQR